MDNNKIIFRIAEEKDVKNIWLIRNRLAVRNNSNNPQKIDFASHKIWFKDKYFSDRGNYCFVLVRRKNILGYCRFDLNKDKYITSIAVNPAYYGFGFGNRLLNRAISSIKTNKEIIAEIMLKNSPSIKLFLKNGFEIYRQDKKIFYLKFKKNDFNKEVIRLYDFVLKQPAQKSQAIVWLQGDRYDRGKRVVELYKNKFAPKIVLTGNSVLIGKGRRPEENNISIKEMENWLIRQGIRRQDIIVDNNSLNTKEQAELVINLAKSEQWRKIILVGSSYHQPRAFLTFLRQAKKIRWRGEIINAPYIIAWHNIPSGRKKFAWQYFIEEKEKINKYKKNLSNVKEGIKYLIKNSKISHPFSRRHRGHGF